MKECHLEGDDSEDFGSMVCQCLSNPVVMFKSSSATLNDHPASPTSNLLIR